MDTADAKITSIDQYIAGFPDEIQRLLSELRASIRRAAPQAVERISYRMPTFYLNGNLVHFAAFKNHIGFYPTPSAIQAFAVALKPYTCSKGAVQFPVHEPLPLDLVSAMVAYRVAEMTSANVERGV